MSISGEKSRVQRVFESVVDPKSVQSVLSGETQPLPLKQGRIEYILAFVDDTEPGPASERIGKVAELAVHHGATVYHLVGALAVLAFGTQQASSSTSDSRRSLVAALREQLGASVKIVHGAADGSYGLFGAKSGLSFTFLVPQFDRVLGVLSRLSLGAVEEFRP